ncbi:MAG: hypothetical protein ACLFSY_04300 [Desulfonatronovibrionaceae bacterium]
MNKKSSGNLLPDFRQKTKKKAILTPQQADRLEFVLAGGQVAYSPETDTGLMGYRLLKWKDPGEKTVCVTPEAMELVFNPNGTVKDEFVR